MLATIPDKVVAAFTDDSAFARWFLLIKNKNMELVPFVYNAAQRDYHSKRTSRDLILKSRQQGFSTKIQGDQKRATMFETASALTIADTMDNTTKLRMIYNRFYEQWPKEYLDLRPPRAQDSVVTITYPLTDSESWIMTAGSRSAGKASTYSHIHFSELAFYSDPKKVFSTAMQAATPNSRVVIESTANGAQGLFHEMCIDAMNGKGGWTLHFYAWWWAPEYSAPLDAGETIRHTEEETNAVAKAQKQGFELRSEQIKWRRDKIADEFQGDTDRFLQEYPEDILSAFRKSGKSVFGPYEPYVVPDDFDLPEEERMAYPRYGGIDWGQDNDYATLSIGDRKLNREVFLGRWRQEDWDVIRGEMRKALYYWNAQYLRPERNSMGSSQIFELAKEMGIDGFPYEIVPVFMTNPIKKELVLFFRDGLREHEYKIIDRDYANQEMQAFVTKRTASGLYQYEASGNNHDDTVIARLLGYGGMFSFD